MSPQINLSQVPQYANLELIARMVVEGFMVGLHKSPFHGFSIEFSEHRLYNSGEPTRHIDWKLYGRTDRMYTKRYEEETNLRCQIVLDSSSSMYYPFREKFDLSQPNKITFSIYAAAALMNLLRRQRDAMGLSVFDEAVRVHTPARSSSVHQKYLYTEMEKLLKAGNTQERVSSHIAESLHFIAENIHKRSLVAIFSDGFDKDGDSSKLFDALQHLRYSKHEVILFHVVDKQHELNFEFTNHPYKFIDVETGQEVKVLPREVREEYTAAMGKYVKELKLRCGQYNIDYVEADISKGFNQVLLPYLLKREKMY